MRLAKIILFVTATVWIVYGGWLFVDPRGLQYAGFKLEHWSTVVEVQAMYGGAEVALGVFALLGALRPKRYMHSALLLWSLVYGALAFARLVGIARWGGTYAIQFGPQGMPDSYNAGALWMFELPSAIIGAMALRLTANHPDLA